MNLLKHIHQVITNPNIYVAAVVGALVGGGTGSAVGFFSGGCIAYSYKLYNELVFPPFNFHIEMVAGALIGLVIGSALGGVMISMVTIHKINKKTNMAPNLSPDNVVNVLLDALWVSLEVSMGMSLGAIIGSLKLPGAGSILGALLGTSFMLFKTPQIMRKKKLTSG